MAHKKGQGSTQNNRDSIGRRLGVKKFGGEFVRAGNIIIRQRGTATHPQKSIGLSSRVITAKIFGGASPSFKISSV